MSYPYRFEPRLMERIWGGQALARLGKAVPASKLIGESWEISDRDEAPSIVANGPARGQTLRQVIDTMGLGLLGTNCRDRGPQPEGCAPSQPLLQGERGKATTERRPPHGTGQRFPLLVKLLDARERLSVQVHPPAAVAAKLGGEPKTEMWYVLATDGPAHLYAGLRRGITRAAFTRCLDTTSAPGGSESPALADCLHRFPVSPGDTVFIPSGRVHAIDAGNLLIEIQQSSDTTYRVYDWGRVGLDGKPRPLHVRESLTCIDFTDYEPALQQPAVDKRGPNALRRLVECEHFHVHKLTLRGTWTDHCDGDSFQILTCVEGELGLVTASGEEPLRVGEFVLLPASLGGYELVPRTPSAAALKAFVPAG